MNAIPALVSIVIHRYHSVWPWCSLIGRSLLLRVGRVWHLHLWREEKKAQKMSVQVLMRVDVTLWGFFFFSPLPIICMLTMALDPGGPLVGSAVFMLGTMRPGPTPWPIIGPAVPPMGPWGPQPCCMGPRIDPLPSMPDLGRNFEIISQRKVHTTKSHDRIKIWYQSLCVCICL